MGKRVMTELRTPMADGDVIELGNQLWRKQVIRHGEITYNGQKIRFDGPWCEAVADAFRRQAFDTVPLMLADRDNTHTMAVERDGGEVVGLEPTPDGLDAIVRLSQDAEQVVRRNKRLGVSVRVLQDYLRPDGQRFPAACQHVLATWDPKLTGMRPWQPVDLSNSGGSDVAAVVIDLSGLTYDQTEEKEGTVPKTITAELNAAEAAALDEYRKILGGGKLPGTPLVAGFERAGDDPASPGDADDLADLTDEEIDALAAEILAEHDGDGDDEAASKGGKGRPKGSGKGDDRKGAEDSDEDTDDDEDDDTEDGEDGDGEAPSGAAGRPSEVAASQAVTDPRDERLRALELANARLQRERDAERYTTERADLARTSGIPPADIDIVRPLLEGAGRTVDLANGQSADAGDLVRKFIARIGEQIRLLDLAGEIGQARESTGDAAAAERRRDLVGQMLAGMGVHDDAPVTATGTG